MTPRDKYREKLKHLDNWDDFLLENSGLPGPRANLELAQAVADEGSAKLFARYRSLDLQAATTNSKHEFLAFCGVLGMGRLLAEGRVELLSELRSFASDSRWRIRESVAMALQRLGDADMSTLINEMRAWSRGNLLERRAAAAALCEPRLLRRSVAARETLQILDAITESISKIEDRKTEAFRVLRKGLAYCWSVAVSALLEEGKPLMEHWIGSSDKDVRWIMRENLKKSRLKRLDPEWVRRCQARLAD